MLQHYGHIFKINLVEILHIILSGMPKFIVCTEFYVKFRYYLSKTPARFREPNPTNFAREEWCGRKLASCSTVLVIDGFPGSGNSYVSNSIRDVVDCRPYIQSHFHHTVQLKRSIYFKVPTVVLVRNPLDACNSFKSKQPELFDWLIVFRWLVYHLFVLKNSIHLNIFLFDEYVRDIDIIRREINELHSLAKGNLIENKNYRRATLNRIKIQEKTFPTKLLLVMAESIFLRIKADLSRPTTS